MTKELRTLLRGGRRPSDLRGGEWAITKKNRVRQTSKNKKSCKSATTKKNACTKKLPTPFPGDLIWRAP